MTPLEMRKNMLMERSKAVQSRHPSAPNSGKGLFSSIKTTLNYAKSNPGGVALRSLPFGLGTVFGIQSEARLAERNRSLLIARAKDASRPRNLQTDGRPVFLPPQQAQAQGGLAYRLPSPQVVKLSQAPSLQRFSTLLARRQPPVTPTTRPVASRADADFKKQLAGKKAGHPTLADWVVRRELALRVQPRRAPRIAGKSVA